MKNYYPVIIGLLIGLAFTLVINAANLRAWIGNQLTVTNLGAEIGSADEVYYFALIKDVRDGNLNFGNASLYEWRQGPAVAGYALLPQGLLARFTTLDLATIILLGDVLYPMLICCFVFLLLRRFLGTDVLSALLALSFMLWWGSGWQRSMSPQVTMTFFLLSLLAFVSDPDGRKMYPRGVCLFLLLLIQPIYAAYILTIEGIDALLHWMHSRSLKEVFLQRWPLVIYVAAAGILHFGLQRGADAEILAETYRRRGLILSHLPTAPLTQILLFVFLGFSVWLIRSKRASDSVSRLIPVLLGAGLIVLNQSLFHGRDAVFGLYYRYPLTFVLWLTAAWVAAWMLPRRWVHILSVLVLVLTSGHMLWIMVTITIPKNSLRSEKFLSSDLPVVMQELSGRPKTEVVFAPIEVSNLVPVLTPHYALFTQYAHFEYVSDRELAERYLLQRFFFPLPHEQTVEGDPLVFGIFAGNIYGRTKMLCRLHLTKIACDKKLSDFIADQSVREFVDAGRIDPLPLLRRFGVTVVVTDTSLPNIMKPFCTASVLAGHYQIFNCRFGTATLFGTGS